ncbi:Protein kinase [Sorangium cellulosum So ce56]|uniref:Protein kinase n=2 Tax=Sorangium cellulosum TaxID=56 RepID=A9GC88_SORC5|nr:Protein kinase [Sorangium cellulosum So ce56]
MISERSRGAMGDSAPSTVERALWPIGSTVKHYEIIRKLGQGGMGAVFLARDTRLGRRVAIKMLLEHGGRGAERFLVEARATARCEHENIVVIHEVDEIDGTAFMVLEYLEGRTLREWLNDRGPAPVPPGLAAELMIPVVRALGCAHRLGIVHRDLKPENIVLTDAGPIKVLDFGIAARLGQEEISRVTGTTSALPSTTAVTDEATIVGTFPYMSPEQWRCEEIDPRCDLWAVGLLLFELCTGAHPFAPQVAQRLAETADPALPMPGARERRPDVGPLGQLIDRCLKKRREERFGSAEELCAALELLATRRQTPSLGEDGSPFAGLSAFQEADAGRFFGREREIASLLERLRNQPVVAVAGPSGAGKSSFVRAGVIPALKRSGERWEAFTLRPGLRPCAALADVLAQTGGASLESAAPGPIELTDPEALLPILRARPGLLGAALRARCRRPGGPQHVLLFVDQLEELYTLSADPAERTAFIACLAGAADDASSPLRVILSLRSDFLDRVAEDRWLTTEVTRGLMLLPPMGRAGLREVLTRPLEAADIHFEHECIVEAMLDALEKTRSPLPLLQFTATRLWEARDSERRLLTRDSYERLGGVAGALSTHADTVLGALSPADQRLCRAVFLRLCTPERTRAVVGIAELAGLAEDSGTLQRVVHHLADARLLLIEASAERDGATVELVHESLIDTWAKLRQWLDESAQDAQFLARLRVAAQQWKTGAEAAGLLWRDRAADDARAWLSRRQAERGAGAELGIDRGEERYLRAVVALADRARRLRWRIAAGVIAALSAIAVAVSLLAVRAQNEAARADREATLAQEEARQARNATRMAAARELERSDPTTALALLREVEPPGVPRGWSDLVFSALHGSISSVVLRHSSRISSVAWSPDGARIATACDDRAARVWRADGTGEPLVLRGHDETVYSVAWSPDGKHIATASSDKTARVWNADGTGEPIVLRGHRDVIQLVAYSPDSRRILTASRDETARVWNADGTGEPIVLRGHRGWVAAGAWSPDGRHIVTASWDNTARVWNADGTGEPLVFNIEQGGDVYWAAWSPDGKRIVTASEDGRARVWNADGTGEPIVLSPHGLLRLSTTYLLSTTFSPDGRRILATDWDKKVWLWNADGTGDPVVLHGHQNVVFVAAWSPDGRHIASGSWDGTARVWSADLQSSPPVIGDHEAAVAAAAWSPDGRRIVTASEDRTVRVRNADGTGTPLILRGHEGRIFSATWSPDGKHIVTTSEDYTVRVWSADGTGTPLILRGHHERVNFAAWSPDGRRIVSASDDLTARIWNADGTGEPLVLRGHELLVKYASWSPDSRRVVTASYDNTARVWNADGTGEPVVIARHEAFLSAAEWSPDGKRVVTASTDKTARVWNVDGSGEPVILAGHDNDVLRAVWSADGKRILTASRDGTARIWSADGKGEPLILRGHAEPVYSAEWSPDGRRVITASADGTARVWTDLEVPRGPDDPKLWLATRDCLPIERRVELLNISEAAARADWQACQRRVEQSVP